MRRSMIAEVLGIAMVAMAASPALAVNYVWNTGAGSFDGASSWSPVGVPGPADTATFRQGPAGPYIAVFGNLPLPPASPSPDNESVLRLIVGELSTDTAVLSTNLTVFDTRAATLGSATGSSGTLNVNGGTFSVSGTAATWHLIIGRDGAGTITVNNGADVTVAGTTALGENPGAASAVSAWAAQDRSGPAPTAS